MNKGILIPPSPKAYKTYSDYEKIEKTEEFYEQMADTYDRLDILRPIYEEKMNNLLNNGSSYKEIINVLMEKEAQLLCPYLYPFQILKQLCDIAAIEEQFNECSVFQNVGSIEDAIQKQQKCIFLLRRLEMDWEKDEEIFTYMQRGEISYILLAELICTDSIIRKVYTGCSVAGYLDEKGLKREALLFLVWLEQRLPYSDRKIMHFAMTFLDMGDVKLAYETLSKHRNPNNDILDLQNTLRDAL